MNDLQEKLMQIISVCSNMEINKDQITDETNLITDFQFDSVKIIEMIVQLEREFNIEIEDVDLDIAVLTKYRLLERLIQKKVNIA